MSDRTPKVSEGRQQRIHHLGFDYVSQPKKEIRYCNLCASNVFVIITHHDRYRFPATAHMCTRCGLVFLNPVMTSEAYAAFYEDTYRRLVSAYHGRLINEVTVQTLEQEPYADRLQAFLRPLIADQGFTTLLDVGGSTGVIAERLSKEFGLAATIIDPAASELAEASSRGLEVVSGMVEDLDLSTRRFDLVIMCQTIDHLLDVGSSLAKIRNVLTDSGMFFVDIVDFRAAYLRNGSVEQAIKIDHPYYLTEATAEAYLRRYGFEVLRKDYASDHLHIGYLCTAAAPDDRLPDPEGFRTLAAEVRAVQNSGSP